MASQRILSTLPALNLQTHRSSPVLRILFISLVAILALGITQQVFRHPVSIIKPDVQEENAPVQLSPGSSRLSELELSEWVEYARWEILVKPCASQPCSDSLDFSLREYETIQSAHIIDSDEPSGESLISVPKSMGNVYASEPQAPTDASHLLFGVATDLDRLHDSLEPFSHWAAATQATIVALIEPADTQKVHQVQQKAQQLGVKLHIEHSAAEFNDRYYALTKLLYDISDSTTKWAIIIDDDTFFLSMSALVRYLDTFDPTEPHYVGAITEDFFQTGNFGLMAFGGAGVFLSIPLLAEIYPFYNECYANKATGDRRIADCIFEHTLTPFTPNFKFHQLDMNGDLSGFYESGRPQPLSIHHWKSWHHLDVTQLAAVSSVCGDSCILKRWRLPNGWYLVNGYSIIRYSQVLEPGDITMEKTWDENGEYKQSLDPLRPKDEKKVSLRLAAVEKESDGRVVRQFYVQKSEAKDHVIELIWRRE